MARAVRLGALALIVLVSIAGSYFVFFPQSRGEHGAKPGAAGSPAYRMPVDNSSCAECHPEIFAQWEASFHKLAWDDPELSLPNLSLKEKPDCWSCHIPEPVIVTGLGNLPQARSVRRSDGVDCISCHYTQDGMAGSLSDDSAPCRPRNDPRIGDITLCKGCHNQHKTHEEWRSSVYYPDTDCNDCHMAKVRGIATRGKPEREYRSHAFPGAHDVRMLASAITMTLELDGGEMLLVLQNDKAGHNFPTDARHHLGLLRVDVVTDKGDRIADLVEDWYRNPYRSEYGLQNRQIKPGEKKTYRASVAATEGYVRARLLYCLQPSAAAVADKLGGANAVVLIEKKVKIEK